MHHQPERMVASIVHRSRFGVQLNTLAQLMAALLFRHRTSKRTWML